jgi:hypothetical protein
LVKYAKTTDAVLPTFGSPVFSVLAFVLGFVMFRLNLWRAWLVLRPGSTRLFVEDPGTLSQVPSALEPMHDALRALGFTSIGSHLEHPRFGAQTLMYDYAHPALGVFASVFVAPAWGLHFARGLAWVPRTESEGPPVRLVLLTPTQHGGFVVSANARRPGANVAGRYLSGALVDAPPDRLLKAHLRRVPELGAPNAQWTIDGRLAAAKEWYSEVGKTELRQQHAVGLLWTLGALGMVGASFFGADGQAS